jgi:3-oxoacyl-[acyl-carrier-protein] synthase-3
MVDRIPIMIRGMGSAHPERVMTNDDFAKMLDTSDEWIRTRTGICERRFASDDEDALTLAVDASRQAMEDAGCQADDIDLVIVATSSPAYLLPSTGCLLQSELGCRKVPAFDLQAACSGFVYGLVTGISLMRSSGYKTALVVGSEKMTAITDFQDRGTCVLLGDGAGAAVLTEADNDQSGLYYHCLGADGDGGYLIWVPAGGSHEPASHETVDRRDHYMKMKGREVYRFAVTKMQEILQQTVDESGLSLDDIAYVVPHQSNLRIIESACEKLGFPIERVAVNIDRFGNTSSASVPMALDEARRKGKVKQGDWVILAGFGAGLTWGSALVRM